MGERLFFLLDVSQFWRKEYGIRVEMIHRLSSAVYIFVNTIPTDASA
jgi:hypothetical protein